MEKLKIKKNEVIFKEGDFSDCMYDIVWGKVGIYADYGESTQKLLAVLEVGEFFGEMGLIDTCARSATAVSVEDGTIIRKITMDDISTYFKENPAKIVTIMQHTGDRLRRLSNDYTEACKTIREYLELEKKKAPKPESLLERMRNFLKK
ncbi:MAG: cyclic nucleotide-binding domain-containing protein [Sphaerochaetaceae bacterium]|nr:cyclic nucleotide-binding domain-containing protein [Sphaerochaetaceae bacterium]